jgi:hypothetical protein
MGSWEFLHKYCYEIEQFDIILAVPCRAMQDASMAHSPVFRNAEAVGRGRRAAATEYR